MGSSPTRRILSFRELEVQAVPDNANGLIERLVGI